MHESLMHDCPNCSAEMEHQGDEPDLGITGGWHCFNCGYTELRPDLGINVEGWPDEE